MCKFKPQKCLVLAVHSTYTNMQMYYSTIAMSFLLQIRTDGLLRSLARKRYVEGDLYFYKIEARMCSDKCFKCNILTITSWIRGGVGRGGLLQNTE